MSRTVSLEGKTVFITGGSRGIGFAAAQAALKRGARVVLAARDEAQLAAAARRLNASPGRVLVQPMDVTDEGEVRRGIDATIADVGAIDVLINNAGGVTQGLFAELPMAAIEAEIALDYLGPLRVLKAVLPHMRQRGSGAVVNIASALAYVAYPSMANYGAAKAAIVRFTEALEFELRTYGIDVVLFVPGHTNTDAIKALRLDGPPVANPEDVGEHIIAAVCARRRFAVNGFGNRSLLAIARFWPWYARYILRYMALRSLPAGTFGTPRNGRRTRPAPECAKE